METEWFDPDTGEMLDEETVTEFEDFLKGGNKMEKINAYKASDGKLFEEECFCRWHEQKLDWEKISGFVKEIDIPVIGWVDPGEKAYIANIASESEFDLIKEYFGKYVSMDAVYEAWENFTDDVQFPVKAVIVADEGWCSIDFDADCVARKLIDAAVEILNNK